jgi:hypothetical protein
LNPVAAGVAATPEKSPHTSVKSRVDHSVEHRAAQGKLETLQKNSPYFSKVNCERGDWLFPTEDCRDPNGVGLAGMLQGISLTDYLQLIDWSSRLIRPGKVNLPQSVPSILSRLQTDATTWHATLEKLLGPNQQIGTYFGNSSRLNEVAAQRGTKYLKNLTGRSESAPCDDHLHSTSSRNFIHLRAGCRAVGTALVKFLTSGRLTEISFEPK